MSGFRVQLDALRQAADGVDGVLYNVGAAPLDRVDADPDVVGHDRLADVVMTFTRRWQVGVDALAEDARTVAAQLRASVEAYQRADTRAGSGFVSGGGPDPAAGG